MATTKQVIDQKQLAQVIQGLDMLENSYERKANAKGVDDEVKGMYKAKAAAVAATRIKIAQGELSL